MLNVVSVVLALGRLVIGVLSPSGRSPNWIRPAYKRRQGISFRTSYRAHQYTELPRRRPDHAKHGPDGRYARRTGKL